MRTRAVVLLAAGLLSGCGRYADFTLPAPAGTANRASSRWSWKESPAPQLAPGAAGEWDSKDVLNPSVIRLQGLYWNLYSGFDGKTWHTGLATSPDGAVWMKRGKVLSPNPATWESDYIAANGSALAAGNEVFYWYQAGPKGSTVIGFARSSDGRRFQRHSRPVLPLGPYGSWDEISLGDPYVLREGNTFWMFYLGQDRARRQRLGLARSADGIEWTKLRSNPILELGEAGAFDENGLGEPAVWGSSGYWWMLYTGRDLAEQRRLGLARSRDGVNWQRLPAVFSGSQEWNAKVICDPAVEWAADGIRVWFGGGDVASPDENLHGRIGFALLQSE